MYPPQGMQGPPAMQHHPQPQPPPMSYHPQQNNFHNVNALASPPAHIPQQQRPAQQMAPKIPPNLPPGVSIQRPKLPPGIQVQRTNSPPALQPRPKAPPAGIPNLPAGLQIQREAKSVPKLPSGISISKGKVFSKVKLSVVISTIFKFSRQKLDTKDLKTGHFKAFQI